MTGAGLMARTFIKTEWRHIPVSILAGVISTRISFGRNACRNTDQCWASMGQLSTAIAKQPGVASVSWANTTPFTGDISAVAVTVEDHPKPAGAPAYVFWETSVTPAYFQQLGLSLRKGRFLNDADRRGTEPVILISEATAKRFWPQGDAALVNESSPTMLHNHAPLLESSVTPPTTPSRASPIGWTVSNTNLFLNPSYQLATAWI